jgi:transcriptional regulator with XRE-family HTH domain
LRERSGKSGGDVSAFLGGERATVSHIESGRHGVSAARVRRLAAFYEADDPRLVDVLASMAEERGKGWWEEYRGILPPHLLDLAELEHHATSFRSLQILMIPGIFQTEDYARAIFTSGNPKLHPDDLASRVEFRTARRRLFQRGVPPPFDAYIHEAALRLRYGNRKTTRAQLEFLLEVCEWPGVAVHVVPIDIDGFVGFAQSMLYAHGPVPQLDTVQIDNAYSVDFLDSEGQLARCSRVIDSVRKLALGAAASRKLIHVISQEM